MTPWIEDTSMRRRYDNKASHEKGRRAKIPAYRHGRLFDD